MAGEKAISENGGACMSYEFDENKNEEITFDSYEETGNNENETTVDTTVDTAADATVETTDWVTISAMDDEAQKIAAENVAQEASESSASAEPELVQMQLSEEGARAAEEKGKKKKEKKERKPMNAVGKSALNGVVFGLCGALAFSGFMVVGNKTFLKKAPEQTNVVSSEETAKAGTDTKKAETTDRSATIPVTDTKGAATISEITKATMPSIVSITVKGVEEVRGMFGTQSYESEGAGSGIVVSENNDELLIATNNHVVSNAEEVSVCFQDSKDAVVAAKVCGTDAKNDLAIVSVKKSDIDKEVLIR